MGGIEKQEK